MVPLVLTAAASTTDAVTQKKIFGLRRPLELAPGTAAQIISDKEMEDVMKLVKSLEELSLLIKGVTKTFKSKAKEKRWFCCIFLGTLATNILVNRLTGKHKISG